MKTPKWKLAILTVVFGLLAGAFVAEVGLRLAGPRWLKDYMKGTNLHGALRYGTDAGWPVETLNHEFVRFKPGQTFKVDYYEYHTAVHTDAWGGRSVGGDPKSKKILVPFIGDSFTFGLGVEDQQTYVSLLGNHPKWHPLNLGVPGSALPNQLDMIEIRHSELNSPRVYVFTFFTGNDVTDIMKYYGYKTETAFEDARRPRRIDLISGNRFLARSYVLQFIELATASGEETSDADKKVRRSWNFRTPSGKRIGSSIYLMMSGSKGYRKIANGYLKVALDRLTDLSKNMRFTPFFVIIPEKHQVETEIFDSQAKHYGLSAEELDRELPDKMIGKLLSERKIEYIDTLPCLINRGGLYYRYDDHLTPAGHAAVGSCIDERLNQKILSYYQVQ